MTTWRKYGGSVDILTNLSVGSIVADSLSLNNFYIGNWDICGGLRVKDNALVSSDLDVCGNLTVGNGFSVKGSINFSDDALIKGNLVISKNLYVKENLYFDANGTTLLHATNGGFGLNRLNPVATLDISSDRVQTLYLKSSQVVNRNVLAQNVNGQGVVVNVDSSTAEIKMFVDNSMNVDGNGTSNAMLKYNAGGEFIVDVSNILRVRPRTIFSNDFSKGVTDARITVYDVSASGNAYMYDVYGVSTFGTGVAINAVAKDTSSNVCFKLASTNGHGLVVAGGSDVGGNGIMATLGLTNSSASIYPTVNMFSGNTLQHLKTGVVVNKYAAAKELDGISNKYALDVNGVVNVSHQELNVVSDVSFQVNAFSTIETLVGYAIGSPSTTSVPFIYNILKTNNGGFTWTVDFAFNGSNNLYQFLSIYTTSTHVIIGGTGGALFIKDGSNPFVQKSFSGGTVTTSITDIYYVSGDRYLLSLSNGSYFDVSALVYGGSIDAGTSKPTGITGGINAMDGCGNVVFFVGGDISGAGIDGMQHLNLSNNSFSPVYRAGQTFNDVSVFCDNSGVYHAVAVGRMNAFCYLHDISSNLFGATSVWQTPIVDQPVTYIDYNAVRVINSTCAIAVGNGGIVAYSNDGFLTWDVLSNDELNTMGNGAFLIGKNLVDIVVGQNDHFFISVTEVDYNNGTSTLGHTKVVDFYAPYLFNRSAKPVLNLVGSATVAGDLNINMGGNVLTNSSSIKLFPTNATTISIGNTSVGGNTIVYNNLISYGTITGNSDLILNANLIVNGNTFLNKNMDLTGDVAMLGNFSVSRDVSFGGNLVVLSDVSFGGNLAVLRDVSFGGNLNVLRDVSFGGNLAVLRDVSFGRNLTVLRDVSFGGNLAVLRDVSFGGNLQLGGGVLDSVSGVLTLGAANSGTVTLGTNNACSTIRIGSTGTRTTNVDVFIGEANKGNVTIYGNLFVPGNIYYQNQTNLEIQNTTILLNDNGLPESSKGAGLLIRDGVDNAGRFVVNNSRLGFHIKATASDNIVNIDVSGLRLDNGVSKGFVGLIPTTSGDGSNFTMTRSVVEITDVSMLDISLNARVLRNNAATLLELGANQVLDTGLSASRLLVLKRNSDGTAITNAALDVSGNAFVSRLGIGTAAVNTAAAIDVSGNAFVSRLGIRTAAVNTAAALDVSGNAFVSRLGIGTAAVNTAAAIDVSGRTVVTANVAAIGSYTNVDANGLTGCINVLSTRGISAVTASGERMPILAARNYGLGGSFWDQYASLAMGTNKINSEGSALDFVLGYAVSNNIYAHVPVCSMLTTSATTGRVGINKTLPTTALDVLGQVSATSFNATSDYRIKREVVDVSLGLLDKLRPVSYYNTLLEKPDIGFLAHEVQDVLPFLVNGTKDGLDMQSLNYTGIIGLLVKEVQALKKEVAALRASV